MSTVWVIEKHRDAPTSATRALMGDYGVRAIASFETMKKLLRLNRSQRPSVVLVDMDDVALTIEQVCAELHALLPDVPLILVHALNHVAADAPLMSSVARCVKPFDGLGVSAVVGGLLRTARAASSVIRYRDLVLDLDRFQYQVSAAEGPQSLPLKEAQLLRLLLERPGICLSRDEISGALWDGVKVASRTIDSHVSRLRKRLEHADVTIDSIYGGGYVLRSRPEMGPT